jgi:hypothetical protein
LEAVWGTGGNASLVRWVTPAGQGQNSTGSFIVPASDCTVQVFYGNRFFYVGFNFAGVPSGLWGFGETAAVDSVPFNMDDLRLPFLWPEGSVHSFALSPTVEPASRWGKEFYPRLVWTGTSGLASVQSGQLNVSASGNVTAHYRLQYGLFVELWSGTGNTSLGLNRWVGWWDEGTSDTVHITALPAEHQKFSYWTHTWVADNGTQLFENLSTPVLSLPLKFDRGHVLGVGFGDPAVSFTVGVEGPNSTSSAVLNVDGQNYTASNLPVVFLWDEGSVHSFRWFDVPAEGGRWIWAHSQGWSDQKEGNITVPGSTIWLMAYYTYTAEWNLSFSVSPSVGGSTDAFSSSVADGSRVNSAWFAYPAEGWYFEGLMADGQFFNASDRSGGDWGVSIEWADGQWGWTVGHAVIRDTFSLDIPAMDRAHNITVVFNRKVYVTFAVEGVYDEDPYWLLTVDGEWVKAKLWSSPVTFEWDWGSVHNFTFYTHSPSDPIFIGWPFNFSTVFLQTNGATSPITATENMTIVGEFRTEWRVDFYATSVTPLRDPAGELVTSTFLTVNGVELGWPNTTYYSVWITHGAGLSYSFEYDVPNGEGGRWHLVELSGPQSSVLVTGAFNCTAQYVEQWSVVFKLVGISEGGTFNAADPYFTVNGTGDWTFDTLTPFPSLALWFEENDTVEYAFIGVLDGVGGFVNGRFVLADVTGPASPLTVPAHPTAVTGYYLLQWKVFFSQTGLDDTATGTVVTVNGVDVAYPQMPFCLVWVDNGTVVAYGYALTVQSSTAGKRFLCLDSGSKSFVATNYSYVDCNFSVQYLLSVSAVGEGRVNVVGSGEADSWHVTDSNVEVWALPDSGSTFNRWLLDGADAGTSDPISVLMAGSHRLVGLFVLKQSVAVNYTVDVQWGLKSGVFTYQVLNESAVPGNLTLCVGAQTFSFRVEDTLKHSENITLADSSSALRVRVVYGDDAETVSFDSTTWVQVPSPPVPWTVPWWVWVLLGLAIGAGVFELARRLRRRLQKRKSVSRDKMVERL